MRILIADDDVEFSATLQLDMAPQGFIVDAVCASSALMNALSQHRYDAVLLAMQLAGQSGLTLLADMRKRGDTTPVVLVSGAQSEAELVQGLDAGADDYIAKPFSLEESCARLRALVRRASGGKNPAVGTAAHTGVAAIACDIDVMSVMHMPIATPTLPTSPTLRQKEVLNLIAQGCQNKHIARELNIAERTVKMHITALLELVGAKNRTHLLVIAGARGLL